MKMLDLNSYLTSSGRYSDRKDSPECTDEVIANAEDLIPRVNALLEDLEWDKDVDVSSGFRTAAANGATSNAAKKSAHMTGKAVDLMDDKSQTLAKKIQARPDLLKKHGLMLEHPDSTKGKNTNWCHLDTVKRAERPSYVFLP